MKFAAKLTTVILVSITAILLIILGVGFLISSNQKKKLNANNAKRHYTLSGRVINAESQAVPGARVTILGRAKKTNKRQSVNGGMVSKTVVTDDDGWFKIENILGGTYTHKVEADGYKTLKQHINIKEDRSIIVTLELSQQ